MANLDPRFRGTIWQQLKRYYPVYPALKHLPNLNPTTHTLVGILPRRDGTVVVVFDLQRISTEPRWHDKITHTGTRMVTLDGDGTRVLDDASEWLATNVRVTDRIGYSPREAALQAAWEADCYRPGTDTRPQDSTWAQAGMARSEDPDFNHNRQKPIKRGAK